MLRLDGVEAAYGPSRVLHGVTLEARDGEVVAASGAVPGGMRARVTDRPARYVPGGRTGATVQSSTRT